MFQHLASQVENVNEKKVKGMEACFEAYVQTLKDTDELCRIKVDEEKVQKYETEDERLILSGDW